MKVTIDMENLEDLVKKATEENINNVVSDCVKETVRSLVEHNYEKAIEETASKAMEDYIKEYIVSTEISVGGGLYSIEEAKTYTVESYIRKQLADIMEKRTLKVKSSDKYRDYDEISFEEFVKNELNVENSVKPLLQKHIKDIRTQINKDLSAMFDGMTKDMLSDTVLNVLMQTETYRNMSNNIKCIADGEQ